MESLEEYLSVLDVPDLLNEYNDMRRDVIDLNLIVNQFIMLLKVNTVTDAFAKIVELQKIENQLKAELSIYKNLVDSIYEVVSVDCRDVGEAFAGIQANIDEVRSSL